VQTSAISLLPSLHFLTQGMFQGVSPILSIGGWTGSIYFSSAVATDTNRTAFANAIVNAVSQYQLDGIEIECALF
jgi:chitinase